MCKGSDFILTYILQHFVALVDDEMADGLQVQSSLLGELQKENHSIGKRHTFGMHQDLQGALPLTFVALQH